MPLGRRQSSEAPVVSPSSSAWKRAPQGTGSTLISRREPGFMRARMARPMVRRWTKGTCGVSSMFSIARVQCASQTSAWIHRDQPGSTRAGGGSGSVPAASVPVKTQSRPPISRAGSAVAA